MAEKLTIAKINAVEIPPGKAEIKIWDGGVNGLALRCFASGGRTWAFRYREGSGGRGSKLRTLRLGSWPAVGIDAARAAAKAHAALVAQGHDPAAVRREHRRQAKSTLGHLLEPGGPYQRSLEARGIVKVKPVMSSLRRGLAKLMNTDIARITRRDLVEALDALNHLPGARHELRKYTRGLLEWATNSGLAPANTLAGLRLPPKTRQQKIAEAAKRRALDDDAIAAVWKAADRHGQYGDIVRLALLTGMRRGEVTGLRRDQVRGDRIVLHPAQTKTASGHEIPLTTLMRGIIARQIQTTSQLLFPSSFTGRALTEFVNLKKRIIDDAGAGHWTLHDLRRTCRTLMSRLGVAEPIAEAAIGHVKASLVGLYNLDQQWAARVGAFERVSDHIARITRE